MRDIFCHCPRVTFSCRHGSIRTFFFLSSIVSSAVLLFKSKYLGNKDSDTFSTIQGVHPSLCCQKAGGLQIWRL